MTRHLAGVLGTALAMAAAVAVVPAAAAPEGGAKSGVAGDTLVLGPSGGGDGSVAGTVGALVNAGMDTPLARGLDPLAVPLEVVTHGGTDEGVKQGIEKYRKITQASNNGLKDMFDMHGQSDKSKRCADLKTDAAKKLGFLQKLGVALKIVDVWGAAWRVAGSYSGSGGIGAASSLADEASKKAAAAGGAFAGSWLGHLGSIVGATAAEEAQKRTVGKLLKDLEQLMLNEQAMKESIGVYGSYTGSFDGGKSHGTIKMRAGPGGLTCTLSGTYDGDAMSGSCREGTADPVSGAVSAGISGDVTYQWGEETRTNGFGGTISGSVDGTAGSGTFSAKGFGGDDSGTWSVKRDGL